MSDAPTMQERFPLGGLFVLKHPWEAAGFWLRDHMLVVIEHVEDRVRCRCIGLWRDGRWGPAEGGGHYFHMGPTKYDDLIPVDTRWPSGDPQDHPELSNLTRVLAHVPPATRYT